MPDNDRKLGFVCSGTQSFLTLKLIRLIAKHQWLGKSEAHHAIASGRVTVADRTATDSQLEVDRFTAVTLDGNVVQKENRALYLMLHKPAGVVSATVDPELPTVLELIDDPDKAELHLVGRLDRFTTGLVLLTNDGRWSKRLMAPEAHVPKVYLVETAEVISPCAVDAFAKGFHFHTEDITTAPAQLEIIEDRRARITLYEGRYHQIKRMFYRIQNRVVSLHREQIGGLRLPPDLAPGNWRPLTHDEAMVQIFCPKLPPA